MDANRNLSLTANDDGTVIVTNRHGTQITVDLHGLRGLTPLEMLLAALGSCSAVDIVELMRKQRAPVRRSPSTSRGSRTISGCSGCG